MRSFHPIFNEDGTISLFRVACLVVLALSVLAYFMLKPHDGGNALAANAAGQDQTGEAAVAENSDDYDLVAVRQMAIAELNDGAEFFKACGNINFGFEGCNYQFSDKLLSFYIPGIYAADDGFTITLTAKGRQRLDDCVKFTVDSIGTFTALDKDGLATDKCSGQTAAEHAVHRITDDLQGRPAPSGAHKVVTSVAAGSAQSSDDIQNI